MSQQSEPQLVQPQPLYVQLADVIRERIFDGSFAAESMLPSESEMMSAYKVSRITVRQSLALLAQEGLVQRVQGKGTFVIGRPIEQNLLGLHDFSKDLLKKGFVARFEILKHECKPATPEFIELFNLQAGEKVLSIERMKYSDQTPVMLERLLIPKAIIPNFPIKDLKKKWFSEILKDEYGIEIRRVRKTVQPIFIDRSKADLLGVSPSSLGLLMDRISWAQDRDIPVVFTRAIVPGNHSRFYIDLDLRSSEDRH